MGIYKQIVITFDDLTSKLGRSSKALQLPEYFTEDDSKHLAKTLILTKEMLHVRLMVDFDNLKDPDYRISKVDSKLEVEYLSNN